MFVTFDEYVYEWFTIMDHMYMISYSVLDSLDDLRHKGFHHLRLLFSNGEYFFMRDSL